MALTRRKFLRITAYSGGGLTLSGTSHGASYPTGVEPPQYPTDRPTVVLSTDHFFSARERRFIEAAVARLIPKDDLGPGALEAGVAEFIDRQMAGPFGRAERWYMQGPWRDGAPEQGYQMRLTPAELYRHCIAKVDAYCRQAHGGTAFAELAVSDQDRVLHLLERGEVPLGIADPPEFFAFLLQNTLEGFLADPMYGGNRDFAGWKLIGYPGPRYDYEPFITDYGKTYPYPTVGILGRQGKPYRG